MHRMWGFPGVAGHQVLTTGTVLIVGGGLALYQMTSLVLGPAGSRQLHISLTIPGAEPEEGSESWSSGMRFALGTLVGPSRTVAARAASVPQGSSATAAHPAALPAAPFAPVAPGAPVQLTPQSPPARPSAPPVPPIVVRPAPLPVVHSGDDAD
jgi:hypothetical protein